LEEEKKKLQLEEKRKHKLEEEKKIQQQIEEQLNKQLLEEVQMNKKVFIDNIAHSTTNIHSHVEHVKNAKKLGITDIYIKDIEIGEYRNAIYMHNDNLLSYYNENTYNNNCSEDYVIQVEKKNLEEIEYDSISNHEPLQVNTFIDEENDLFDTSYYLIPFFFKDHLVRKLLGKIMKDGKKQLAFRILQGIFLKLKYMTGISPIKILKSLFKMANFIFLTTTQTTGTRTIQKPHFLTTKQRLFYIIGFFFKELEKLHLEDYLSIIDKFSYLVLFYFKSEEPTV